MAKWPELKDATPGLRLHLVGPLQTNKARNAIALFDVIETVDRPKLARKLAGEMDRAGKRPSCFIEVNTGEEAQKAGVLPADADAFGEAAGDEGPIAVDLVQEVEDDESAPRGVDQARVDMSPVSQS